MSWKFPGYDISLGRKVSTGAEAAAPLRHRPTRLVP